MCPLGVSSALRHPRLAEAASVHVRKPGQGAIPAPAAVTGQRGKAGGVSRRPGRREPPFVSHQPLPPLLFWTTFGVSTLDLTRAAFPALFCSWLSPKRLMGVNPVETSKILFVKGQTIDPLNWLYLREKNFREFSF